MLEISKARQAYQKALVTSGDYDKLLAYMDLYPLCEQAQVMLVETRNYECIKKLLEEDETKCFAHLVSNQAIIAIIKTKDIRLCHLLKQSTNALCTVVEKELIELNNLTVFNLFVKDTKFTREGEKYLLKNGSEELVKAYASYHEFDGTLVPFLLNRIDLDENFITGYVSAHHTSFGDNPQQVILSSGNVERISIICQGALWTNAFRCLLRLKKKNEQLFRQCLKTVSLHSTVYQKIGMVELKTILSFLKDESPEISEHWFENITQILQETVICPVSGLVNLVKETDRIISLLETDILHKLITSAPLFPSGEIALIKRNDESLYREYIKRYDLSFEALSYLLDQDKTEWFKLSMKTQRFTAYNALAFFKYAAQEFYDKKKIEFFKAIVSKDELPLQNLCDIIKYDVSYLRAYLEYYELPAIVQEILITEGKDEHVMTFLEFQKRSLQGPSDKAPYHVLDKTLRPTLIDIRSSEIVQEYLNTGIELGEEEQFLLAYK